MKPKKIWLSAISMNSSGHISPGLWAHPRDKSVEYTDLEYWNDLAQTLERGKFDALFLADSTGVHDVYRGNAASALAQGVGAPINDPFLIVPAMAVVTKHLAFGVTGTVTYEPPYLFARRLSTLDHLTKGRIAWNIVTGYLDSAAKGSGLLTQSPHDDRYDVADEYMEVVYKLWEGSWDDDAVIHDRENRIFADPTKVRKISHSGKYFQIDAYHLCEPSPQRTPVLFQAGASNRGMDFAAKHAEAVFITGPSKGVVRARVADLRRRAAARRRDPSELLIITLLTVIPGRTDAEAKAKHADYQRYSNLDGALSVFGAWTGIDFSTYDFDAPLQYVSSNAIQSRIADFTDDNSRLWTVRDVGRFMEIGGPAPVLVGSAERVADEMIEWVEETGIDGFNLAYAVSPETYVDFVDLVVPELQRRGAYKEDYNRGTLREKLNGVGEARLPDDHPGAHYRSASITSSPELDHSARLQA